VACLIMPKPNPLDSKLAALYALEDDAVNIAVRLLPFLHDKSNIVIAKAASFAARLEAASVAPELVQVFLTLMRKPVERDPGCMALTAIAKALLLFEFHAAEVYFAGLRHIQMEPGFGKSVEVAGELRGLCARGIVRMGHPDALLEILPLLADTLPARIGAVRAIAETGKLEAELLLRLHVLRGDSDAEVLGECFTALLGLMPQRSVPFVAERLASSDDEVAEMAALALGESRLPAAFPFLREAFLRMNKPGVHRSVLFAIAVLRRDEALEFLTSLLDGGQQQATGALAALAIHKTDPVITERVKRKLAERESSQLDAAFQKEWRE
jgi:HEAT repeat protein